MEHTHLVSPPHPPNLSSFGQRSQSRDATGRGGLGDSPPHRSFEGTFRNLQEPSGSTTNQADDGSWDQKLLVKEENRRTSDEDSHLLLVPSGAREEEEGPAER